MAPRALLPRGLIAGIALLVALIVVGFAGFLLQGLSPVDAIFTTVSAITTVGYTPSHPLTSGDKLFATFLILAGVGTGIYVLGSVTEFLVEGGLRGSWEQRRVARHIESLSGHYIISGFGRVGQQVAAELTENGTEFLVVDDNPATIRVARERGYPYLEGDATNDAVLEAAGVKRAGCLLACADSDVTNVYVTLSARSLNPNLYVVARAATAAAEQKLMNAGADRVVSPYVMAGNRMAHLAVHPLAADYADLLLQGEHVGVQVEERLIEPGSALAGRTVQDVRAHELAGAQVLAIERDGQLITSVSDDREIVVRDRILVAGTPEQIATFDAAGR